MSTRSRWTVATAGAAVLGIGALIAVATGGGRRVGATAAPDVAAYAPATEVTVYKSPACGCCSKWVEHLEAAGYDVTALDVEDVSAVKAKHGVPADLSSCHTATVGGYVIEGHVPADALTRLLEERPDDVAGLAVPGMPMGSPGMEGPRTDRYEVVAFGTDGSRRVFESR